MNFRLELRSKLADGLLTGFILVLGELLLVLLITPVSLAFGRPGMLVYTVSLLAASALCLERSLNERLSDLLRGRWGVVGGLIAWMVIENCHVLGNQSVTGDTGMLIFLFCLSTAIVLWRKLVIVGLRYYVVMVFLGWCGHIGLWGLTFLTGLSPIFKVAMPWVGILAGGVCFANLVILFFQSRSQLQRLNAALVLWCTVMILIYVFRGGMI